MRSEIVYRKPKNKWFEKARVILAITGKDILEAVKNKSVISTILSALFIVVAYRFIPILSRGSDPPVVFIYSQVETEIVKKLETSDTLTVYTGYETLEAMQRRLADWDVPAIGVSIPGDVGTGLSTNRIVMDGYILNWTSDENDNELISLVEEEFSELLDRPVRLDSEGHTVYPWPESDGISTWMGLSAVFAVSMIGITLIPHLMLEEKKSRTIDFLMVSPATATDLTIAKALTGAFYALLGAIIVISIYSYTVVQWWLVPLLILIGISFLIGFGLIMGLIIKDRSQLTLVGFFIFIPLFLPVMLSLMSPLFPDALITVFQLVPTTVLFNLFRIVLSGSGNFSAITVVWYLAYLLAWGVGVLMIVAALVRRLDRRDSMYGLETRSTGADAHIRSQQSSTPDPIMTEKTGNELTAPFERVKPAPIIAIALKDIREAINNKLFVSILIGTGFIVLSQSAMQNFVISRSRAPVMLVYDRGNSAIIQALDQQPDTHVAVVDSLPIVEKAITDMPSKDLGLILPEDFDEIAFSQEEIVLEGLYAHWFKLKDIDTIREDFETLLSEASGTRVRINLEGNQIYPEFGKSSAVQMASIITSVSLLIIGLLLVPVLFVEEFEAKTIQVLMVSPASYLDIVIGKSLASVAYIAAASLIAVLVNVNMFVQWGVLLTAIILVGILAIGLGLVIGTAFRTGETINLWSSMLLLVLIGSAFVPMLAGNRLGEFWRTILNWMPGSMIFSLFQSAMVSEIHGEIIRNNIIGILGYCLVAFVVVMLIMRKKQARGF